MKSLLNVTGMKCGGCESTVSKAVQALAGIAEVKPDHKAKTVEVEFDESQTSLEAIKQAIAAQGFQVG